MTTSKAGTVGGAPSQPSPECCMCGDYGFSYELFQCKVCQFRSQHRYSFIFPSWVSLKRMNGLRINPPNPSFSLYFVVCVLLINSTFLLLLLLDHPIPQILQQSLSKGRLLPSLQLVSESEGRHTRKNPELIQFLIIKQKQRRKRRQD